MSEENLGVASSDAGTSLAPAAPTETSNDINSITPTEGSSEVSASANAQVSSTTVDRDSVGMKNLRAHADSLRKDIDRYKPIFEQVDTWGGLDAIKPLVDFHNTFISQSPNEYEESGVYSTLNNLYESNPVNFGTMVKAIAEQYPDVVKEVLAKTDPSFRQLMEASERDNYRVPDEELDDDIISHRELKELRQYKANVEAAKQKQQTQTLTQQAEQRIGELKHGLFSDAFTSLQNLEKQLSPQLFEKVSNAFFEQLDKHEELASAYYTLQETAKIGAKYPIGMQNTAKRIVNNILADCIKNVSGQSATPSQPQQPRIEVSPRASAPPQQKNIPSAGDPDFTTKVAEDWARRTGWPM